MRIGINTLFLVPGDVGGTEVYLRQNLTRMVGDNQDLTFVLFTTRDNTGSLRQDLAGCLNVEFIELPFNASFRPLRIIAEQTLLPWKVRGANIDVLWSPGYTAPLWCSTPQALTIHDLQYKSHPDDVSFLERITLDFLVRNGCRTCDSIITVSNFSAAEVVRFGFASADKISVIHEAADPCFAEKINTAISGLVQLPQDVPYILCVAHTYPHKRVHTLIQAFGLVADKVPHHLVLVGNPRRGEPAVQQCLGMLPDRGRVHRINNLEYVALKAIYQQADLFVLPSEYEGFGLPLLESLLAGTPAVTTNKGSLPEVGGEHVVYLERNDPELLAGKIREMLTLSASDRDAWVKRGKSWAQTFSWEKSASETIEVLKGLVSD